MSLRHAILTALVERPSSGRELARRFDRSIGWFWPATHQQIYRELGGLERDGLVATTDVAATRGRARTYAVLPVGEAELRRWVGDPGDLVPVRDPLFVRIRAQAALGGDDGPLGAELARHRVAHERRVAEFEQIQDRDFAPDNPENPEYPDERARLQHLVLQAGLGREREWLRWLDAALAVVPHPQPPAPRPASQEDA